MYLPGCFKTNYKHVVNKSNKNTKLIYENLFPLKTDLLYGSCSTADHRLTVQRQCQEISLQVRIRGKGESGPIDDQGIVFVLIVKVV